MLRTGVRRCIFLTHITNSSICYRPQRKFGARQYFHKRVSFLLLTWGGGSALGGSASGGEGSTSGGEESTSGGEGSASWGEGSASGGEGSASGEEGSASGGEGSASGEEGSAFRGTASGGEEGGVCPNGYYWNAFYIHVIRMCPFVSLTTLTLDY